MCYIKKCEILDVTLNLESGTFEPFRKEELPPVYVNKKSNHPRSVTGNIPTMIEKRLNSRCSNERIFTKHKTLYETALKRSGYNATLKYNEDQQTKPPKPKRKLFWFNPPFNSQVRTNIGKEFLKILDKNFPKGTKWHKHFNRHTVKLSYSCTRNIASHIASHNQRILKKRNQNERKCNCTLEPCPLNGECLTTGLVYSGTLQAKQNNFTYYGSTGNTFKERYSNHKQDLKNEDKAGTTLSNKYWELKKGKPPDDPTIKWQIVNKCQPLSAGMPLCDVCLTEKTRILLQHDGPEPRPPSNTLFLNQRSEIFAKCPHRRRFVLRNCKNLYK